MINFLGTGSAFHTEKGNTSAFIKQHTSLLLIDCGGTTFPKIQELELLEELENIYVIITHTHPDHVGSLGEVIFYSYYILNKIPTIFFPDKDLMVKFLSTIGVSKEMYTIRSSEKLDVIDKQLGEFQIEFIPVPHVKTIPAHGFVLKINGDILYYSGDANRIPETILNRFKKGEIDWIYQDTCGLDYDGNSHLSLSKLEGAIQLEFRNRVYCMHLDKHISEKEIQEKGFCVVSGFRKSKTEIENRK